MNKLKCDVCGEMAVWFYMPSSEDPDRKRDFCDECVPRGCTCNENLKPEFDNIESYENPEIYNNPDNYVTDLDELGREYPCCEYFHDTNGWDEETTAVDILQDSRDKSIKKVTFGEMFPDKKDLK